MDLSSYCLNLARDARLASQALVSYTRAIKDRWLLHMAELLRRHLDDLLDANRQDVQSAEALGLTPANLDRLRLTPQRIQSAAEGLRQVAALPDPVGQVREGSIRPNGLQVQKISVPLGVIFFLYESRPNVTVDAAALCVKSGNAVILRGGKEAQHSNALLHQLLVKGLQDAGLPEHAVQLVSTPDRDAVGHLLRCKDYIDLTIPRGGESLIRRVMAEAKMPVLKHYLGNCHIYVDRSADYAMAEKIIINAKCRRPGVCNALESLLVHDDIAQTFLPQVARSLQAQGVALRVCQKSHSLLPNTQVATEEDYAAEYCDLILSIRVVADLEAAISHINRYGSKHTDAIITNDYTAARRFTQAVDSSAVMVNASTRFNDGFELGLGAEIGISTDKFHARGPCGLQELTTYKYVVLGEGQIRE